MSTCKFLSVLVLMASVSFAAGIAVCGPDLGLEVRPEEIAAWDISVLLPARCR